MIHSSEQGGEEGEREIMKANEYEKILRPWYDAAKEWLDIADKLADEGGLTQISPESPILCAPWEVLSAYTEHLIELLKDSDRWLDWFLNEAHLGDKEEDALAWVNAGELNEKEYKVTTLKILCGLMEEVYK